MNPVHLRRMLQTGIDQLRAGRLKEAAVIFAQIRAAEPRNFEAWHLGGNIALLQGNPGEAAELYARALRLNPKSATLFTCLGVARMALGDSAGAEKQLRSALHLEPKNAAIWAQLATLLSHAGSYEEAAKCHRQAVALDPKSAPAWHGYGTMLSNLNHCAEALECECRALAVDPTYAPARRGYAVALQKCHRVPESVREYESILEQNPRQLEVQSHRLFALNYLATSTPASLFAAHQVYGEMVGNLGVAPSLPNPPEPQRKIRVAFFSADFREHPVACFIEPLLQHLDRSQFEILCYSTCAKADAVTERFRQLAAVWRDFPSTVENVIEPVIRADAPDIAVDLGGHTGINVLPLLARRLAPVQISYLGYPNTTGLRAMDYRLVDAITDPFGEADPFHTEALLRFAPTAWAYSPPAGSPPPASPPALSRGSVTFGSFNNFSKVTDETLGLWSRLLAAVPGSRLFLKSTGLADPAIAAQVRIRLRAAGLPDERVALAAFTATVSEHLATYAQIDIALDTAPYNGTTTTCEALWMGVPVVTMCGDRHAARVGASLLQAAGHPEWIAGNQEVYLTIAASLASDPSRLTELRHNLRDELQRSVLLDHVGQATRFGVALRDCWQKWCATKQ